MINKEVLKYKAGLACASMHFFKVTYNKHTLALEDLSTLEDQNWVNDQVGCIHAILYLLHVRNQIQLIPLLYRVCVFFPQVINMYGELIMDTTNHKVYRIPRWNFLYYIIQSIWTDLFSVGENMLFFFFVGPFLQQFLL